MDASPRRAPTGAVPRRPAPPTAGAPAPGARAPGPPPMGVEPPAAGRRPPVAGRRGAVGGPARLAGPAGPRKAVPLAGASGLERAAGVQGRASAARTRRDGGLGPMRTRAVRLRAAGRATAGLALATVDQGRPVTASRDWVRVGSAPVARPRVTAR